MTLYDLVLFAHVLLFVYWLGSDIGVFHSITYALKPDLSLETRQTVMAIVHWIDAIPRICFALMVPVGVTLSVMTGFVPLGPGLNAPVLAVTWLVSLGWLVASVFVYNGRSGVIAQMEFGFRLLLMLGFLGAGLGSIAGYGPVIEGANWLALKLILFAGIIACSLALEILGKPMLAALDPIMQGNSTPELEAKLSRAVQTSRGVVVVLWGLIAVTGFLGVAKFF